MDVSWDVVILDRMLPGIADGLSIVETIRVHNRTTPRALASPDERIRGLRSGADDRLIQTLPI
jgi:two-component system, OmpR family, response regulator